MNPWQCCRTCLCEHNLNPIFPITQNNEKYTNALFSAIGIKIIFNDDLPQTMCSPCILFINQINDFKKQCIESNKKLQSRMDNKDFDRKQVEFKYENEKFSSINIIDDDSNDEIEDFTDHEDDIPLDVIQLKSKQDDSVKSEINKEKYTDNQIVKRKTRKKQEIKRDRIRKIEKRVKEKIVCEHCNKILTSRTSLRNHYKIHLGFDVVCEHCGKKFITKRYLLMHCKAKHGYEKTDKCSFCAYTASNAEQVKIHERLHTGEKPYTCETCKAGFHRKSSYLQHIAIHLPDKTVKCDLCPALFKSATLMRIHRNRHRAPSHKFVCVLCDWTFVRRSNVTRHIQRSHRIVATSEHIRKVAVNNVT